MEIEAIVDQGKTEFTMKRLHEDQKDESSGGEMSSEIKKQKDLKFKLHIAEYCPPTSIWKNKSGNLDIDCIRIYLKYIMFHQVECPCLLTFYDVRYNIKVADYCNLWEVQKS